MYTVIISILFTLTHETKFIPFMELKNQLNNLIVNNIGPQ